jgi:hypothetical protein
MNPGSLCVRAHLIEQHRLPHSAQAYHEDAFGRIAGPNSCNGYSHLFPNSVAVSTGKFRRGRPAPYGYDLDQQRGAKRTSTFHLSRDLLFLTDCSG